MTTEALTVEQVREGLGAHGITLTVADDQCSCPVCDGLMALTVRQNGNGAHLECAAGCDKLEIVGAIRSGLIRLIRQQVQAQQAGEPTLKFISAAELRDATPDEPPWVWDGYLAHGGITLVAGKPKAGKSTLVLALVEALAAGATSFLGRAITPGAVVYVSEEGAGTLVNKLPASHTIRVLTREAAWPRPSWPVLVEAAAQEGRRIGAALLVIDAFAFWASFAEGAENDAAATQGAIAALGPATTAGLAVVLVHHQRKSGGEGGDAVRGSGAIFGAVDALVEVERPDEKAPRGHRRLVAVGRWPSTPAVLLVDRDPTTCAWRVLGTADDRHDAGELGLRERIIDALPDDHHGITERALVELLDVDARKVSSPLRNLVHDGGVCRSGGGRKGDPYLYERMPSQVVPAVSPPAQGSYGADMLPLPKGGASESFFPPSGPGDN
jgi:hypothetical protein